MDDETLYVSDGSNTNMLDKATGHLTGIETALHQAECGDGVSVFGIDTNNVERHYTGRPSMEFQRVSATDADRVPWPGMLAVPTGRNL